MVAMRAVATYELSAWYEPLLMMWVMKMMVVEIVDGVVEVLAGGWLCEWMM